MKTGKRFIAIPLFLLFFNSNPVFGQVTSQLEEEFKYLETEKAVFELGEFIVSSKSSMGPTSRVYEVTAEDIMEQNARTVGEALRFVPGLFYEKGGTKNSGTVIIRGTSQAEYTVFIDGRPVYEPYTREVDLDQLPIDNVAKIKVVKGPVAAPYGPNTLGGVINIITKKGTEKPSTGVQLSYEGNNTYDYWIDHGGQWEKLNYFLAGSFRESNGFYLPSDFESAPFEDGGLREESSYNKYNFSINLGYDFTKEDRIAFLAGYYEADSKFPLDSIEGGGSRDWFWRWTDWKRYFFDLTGETRLSDIISFKGKFYYDQFSNELTMFTDQTFSEVDNVSDFDNPAIGGNIQATFDLSRDVNVKVGSSIKKDWVNRRDTGEPWERQSALTTDIFLDAEYSPLENLLISFGANFDNFQADFGSLSHSSNSFNPTGAIIFKPLPKTRLYTSLGKRSSFPKLIDLFRSKGMGNTELKPENAFLVEIGATQLLWDDRVEVEFTWFRTEVDDIIDLVGSWGSSQFQNVDSHTYKGFESMVSVELTKEFSFLLDYTYMDSNYDNKPTDDLFERPRNQFNSRMKYVSTFGLSAFLQGSYIDGIYYSNSEKIDSFFLLDGKISYEVWKGIKPYIAVENLTDENYELEKGFPLSGRSFLFGVSARF